MLTKTHKERLREIQTITKTLEKEANAISDSYCDVVYKNKDYKAGVELFYELGEFQGLGVISVSRCFLTSAMRYHFGEIPSTEKGDDDFIKLGT